MKRKSQHQKPLNMFSWMNKFIQSYIKLQIVIRRRFISLVRLNDKLLLYLFINGCAGTKWVVHVQVCYSEGYSHRQAQGNLTLVLLIPNTTEPSFLTNHFGTIHESTVGRVGLASWRRSSLHLLLSVPGPVPAYLADKKNRRWKLYYK